MSILAVLNANKTYLSKAIGFDEIRVRYRQQRRAIIREIILNQLAGDSMKEYIAAQILQLPREENRKLFFEDIMEDLQEINQNRIAGLGITSEQLNTWLAAQKS